MKRDHGNLSPSEQSRPNLQQGPIREELTDAELENAAGGIQQPTQHQSDAIYADAIYADPLFFKR